jgi:medium-chain acyl-[acyl-carrier-protein] hydrolase
MMTFTPWLKRQQGSSGRVRLYCFPYAGGNAFHFLSWQTTLGPTIEVRSVQLPGRGERLAEKPYERLPELVNALAAIIVQQDSGPFAFFGHSLGGLIAFEVARYCHRSSLPRPLHIFASGCAAPQDRSPNRGLHKLGDDDLIAALKEYDDAPSDISQNAELRALMLPTIRSDFALAENYQYRPSLRLDMPITALAGKRDDISPEQLKAWQKETSGPFRLQWFEGGHFFIHSERNAILAYLKRELVELQCT